MKLVKDGKGNYYSYKRLYFLERCLDGWDVYECLSDGKYYYVFSVDTLKEFRLIMENRKGGDYHS